MTDWIQRGEFAGKRVTVMGLGAFGGQIGAARFLARRGAKVLVTDLKDEAALRPALEQLQGLPVAYRLGGHRLEDFESADLVVASPAVRPDSEFLQAAARAGAAIESEITLFWRYCPAAIAGVTGSNGKSTTTSLLGEMARRDPGRRAWVGGNLGGSVLEAVDRMRPDDLVVLELSSFQLEALARLKRSPHVAVATNFSPNHLDWHADLDAYRRAKQTILRFQNPDDFAVLNADDADVRSWSRLTPAQTCFFSTERALDAGAWLEDDWLVCRLPGRPAVRVRRERLQPPGRHNAANALAAMAAAAAAGVSADAIVEAIENFRGLEHRLEFVGERGGVRYYNDSKATTPAAGVIGVDALSGPEFGPLIVIAGGYDKHLPLDAFAAACARSAKLVVALGQVRDQLAAALRAAGAAVAEADSFEDAVRRAQAAAEPGDVVLLCPACASWDMFNNFEERGREFKRLVMEGPAAASA